ncbi:MAG: lysophospholipase [Acidobacteria bacterium]|nr:lysophospholipase [Acidobacteriota bacterium]
MRQGEGARPAVRQRLVNAVQAAAPVIVLREQHLMPGARIRAAPAADGLKLEIPVAPGIVLRGVVVRRPDARLAVVYFGGNGEVVGSDAGIVRLARTHPFDVYSVNYRGYGPSDGSATLDAVVGDGVAVFDAVASRPEVAGKPLVVYGFSLGSWPALKVAGSREVTGIVLQSPPSAAAEVVPHLRTLLPWYLRPFARIAVAPEVAAREDQPVMLAPRARAPLLVLHGEADRSVPIACGRELFARAGSADKEFVAVPGGGHIDLWDVGGEALHACLAEFLDKLTRRGKGC